MREGWGVRHGSAGIGDDDVVSETIDSTGSRNAWISFLGLATSSFSVSISASLAWSDSPVVIETWRGDNVEGVVSGDGDE